MPKKPRLDAGWMQFVLAVVGALFFAGTAWGLSNYRITSLEKQASAQSERAEEMGERLHRMDIRQAVMAEQLKTIHDALAKPK